jgi:hypothetical protein
VRHRLLKHSPRSRYRVAVPPVEKVQRLQREVGANYLIDLQRAIIMKVIKIVIDEEEKALSPGAEELLRRRAAEVGFSTLDWIVQLLELHAEQDDEDEPDGIIPLTKGTLYVE